MFYEDDIYAEDSRTKCSIEEINSSDEEQDIENIEECKQSKYKKSKEPQKEEYVSDKKYHHDAFTERVNLLFHSPGGTGKSYILKDIHKSAESYGLVSYICSTTGLSAVNIGGITIHSFSGIGIGDKPAEILVRKMSPDCKERIISCNLLCIDEISMLGDITTDLLSDVFKLVRRNSEPFGGIQLVLSGDFLQLPPVGQDYTFRSKVWKELNIRIINLTTPHRFTNLEYYNMMSRVRLGEHTSEDISKLVSRVYAYKLYMTPTSEKIRVWSHYLQKFVGTKHEYSKDVQNIILGYLGDGVDNIGGIKPTELHCRKLDVDEINMKELNKLKGKTFEYSAEYAYKPRVKTVNKAYYEKIIKSNVIEKVYLKNGAQVMLTINRDIKSGLVNGSRGVVVQCLPDSVICDFKVPITESNKIGISRVTIPPHLYEYSDKKMKVTALQIPLILAYSTTIHKIQGATLDSVIVDFGKSIFDYSLIYVGLSRVRNLESVLIKDLNINMIKPNPIAMRFERGEFS